MIAIPHITSEYGTNTGSCRNYAEYLLKYNEYFFSYHSDRIGLEEAIHYIDSNSKNRLLKTEAKWYAPIYALSEDEAQFIAKKITGREVKNYNDLLEHEKVEYNKYVVELAKDFQNTMAENFEKKDLGIINGENLFYIGVVENKRKYSIEEKKSIWSLEEVGEAKSGFNTHIHIIQSRLANNGKQSKISPMAKNKSAIDSPLAGRKGFNRVVFSEKVEKKFDTLTGYYRKIEQSFTFKNEKKKNANSVSKNKSNDNAEVKNYLNRIKIDFILNQNKIKIIEKNFSSKEIKRLQKEVSCREYFSFLASIGLLEKIKSDNSIDYYKSLNDEEIVVMDTSWRNVTTKDMGYIYNAPMYFENTKWLGAMNRLASIDREKEKKVIESYEVKEKKSQKFSEILYETKPWYFKPYVEEHIDKNTVDMYLTPIKYQTEKGKLYESFALENDNGGYYLYNSKFNNYTKVGEGGITTIKGAKDNDRVVVFDNYMDYLRFLELNNARKISEKVIIVNGIENKNKLLDALRKENEGKEILFLTSTTLYYDMKNAGVKNCKDIRNDFGISKELPTLKDVLRLKKIREEVNTILEEQKQKRNRVVK